MQQQFKKLAISGAISALIMGAGVAEAHVSYNSGPSKNGNPSAVWSGGAPTGYAGTLPANWVANVHNGMNPNVSYEVSAADAADEGFAGHTVQSHNNKWNPASSWGAALGFGLIDMHHAGNLTIEVKADTSGGSGSTFTPGFTVFSGWDTGTGNKHQGWNADANNPGKLSSTGLTYLDHSATTTAGGMTTLTLSNLAAGHYSIWIGGNGAGCTTGGSCLTPANQAYMATITASAVPVPAAAWLMGTGLLGLVGMRRKKVVA